MCQYQRHYKEACGEREQIGFTAASEAYLEDVKQDIFTIRCFFDTDTGQVQLYIRFRPAFEGFRERLRCQESSELAREVGDGLS